MGNADRGPTAVNICRRMASEKGIEIDAESAGLMVDGGRQLTKEIADSADRIFVMEHYMKDLVIKDYSQNSEKITAFNIPDNYEKDDPELVSWLEEELARWV